MYLITYWEICLFCTFAAFLIVSLTRFINKPDSSRDLIILMTSFISSLEIINVILRESKSGRRPDPNFFFFFFFEYLHLLLILLLLNLMVLGLTLVANVLSKFFIKGNPVFSNGPKRLPKNLADWLISCNWILIILY